MAYVDGFVIPVPKARLDEYKTFAAKYDAIWKEYGALKIVEAVADDVPYGELTSFPRAVQVTEDEVVVFSWISYHSREHRDEVNRKVMADPRLQDSDMSQVPFDGKRMIFGGFEVAVEV